MYVIGTLIGDIYIIATGIGTIDVDQAITDARFNEPLASFVEQSNQSGIINIRLIDQLPDKSYSSEDWLE